MVNGSSEGGSYVPLVGVSAPWSGDIDAPEASLENEAPAEAPEASVQQARCIRPAVLVATAFVSTALLAAFGCRMQVRAGSDRQDAHSPVELDAVHCHTAGSGEACHGDVMFVKNKFLKEHPDWYRGLSTSSSFKDIQAYLSTQKNKKGKPRCPWPCGYVRKKAAGASRKKGSCFTARTGDDCYNQVKYTRKLIAAHPEWYGGLTPDSSASDIQAYLHEQKGSVCKAPCGREKDKEPPEASAKNCRTAVKGEACWDAITWVRSKGFKQHPEWFKGITASSTPEEIQNYLSGRNGSHCSRPACHCHTARPGEDCYTHVAFTIKALPDHPSWYPGLTTNSTVKEVQAFMHEETTGDKRKRVCPLPCGLNHDKTDKHHRRCHTAIAGETCYDQVLWAMDEVDAHPEWYPGLNSSSTVEEFQALLHLGKKDNEGKHCPIPCDEEAVDKAANNSEWLNCHIAQQGEPCYDAVVEAYEGVKKHPEKYDGISEESTFEEIQAFVHHHRSGAHCDQMPCKCRTAVKGEKCYESVSWVLSSGIKLHKARYEMLSANSTREEVQHALHAQRQHHCLLPCSAPWKELAR